LNGLKHTNFIEKKIGNQAFLPRMKIIFLENFYSFSKIFPFWIFSIEDTTSCIDELIKLASIIIL